MADTIWKWTKAGRGWEQMGTRREETEARTGKWKQFFEAWIDFCLKTFKRYREYKENRGQRGGTCGGQWRKETERTSGKRMTSHRIWEETVAAIKSGLECKLHSLI